MCNTGGTPVLACRYHFAKGSCVTSQLAAYEKPETDRFLKLLQEATRPSPAGSASNYVPPSGGELAEADYHHFIFGQRGSGKSSLLRHLEAGIRDDKRAGVWIDQEIFAGLAYPDVLVSTVLELFKALVESLKDRQVPVGPWSRLWAAMPWTKSEETLPDQMRLAVAELHRLKLAPVSQTIKMTITDEGSEPARPLAG